MSEDRINTDRFIQTFEIYEQLIYPEGLSEAQREALLRAFFAGGAMIIGTMQAKIADGMAIPELKEDVDYMQSDIMSELALRDARMQ